MSINNEQAEIIELLNWLRQAHKERNAENIVNVYSSDVLICDLAPPLSHRGMSLNSVSEWLNTWDGPIEIDGKDVEISISEGIAVVTSLNRMQGYQGGIHQDIWYRTTLCLKKFDSDWRITHDHTSVPFYMDGSYRAATDLTP